MKRIYGNTRGLKANQIHRLESLYRRRIPTEQLITHQLARDISRLSHGIRRQVGLLINRRGKITHVIVGDYQQILIPGISEYRTAPGRLRGLRCVHTHLTNESITRDDLTDLALLKLDIMVVIGVINAQPFKVFASHILPKHSGSQFYNLLEPLDPNRLDIGCLELIHALELELASKRSTYDAFSGIERAILVSVSRDPGHRWKESLAELEELTLSCGIDVAAKLLQQRLKINPRFLLGPGKLQDLSIAALHNGATLIIFDQELNPSQIRAITDRLDLKVIDRTQLILDIFAQRAQTREGKLQVELAQLKYLLPRLISKNTAMSRLTGGIGGRGPGETKLEINRRRARDRIAQLEQALSLVMKQRKQQRAKRHKRGLPVISIIGYTNAGKSTLLNTLTKSHVLAESRLFATLDPSSRRLKFPKDIEVIITDTVGFIKDLPQDLRVAFRATLEELEHAKLLLHVIDISHPRFQDHIESVETILAELNLIHIPLVRVLNKRDMVKTEQVKKLEQRLEGIAVSAKDESTLAVLIEKMQMKLQQAPDKMY
ncbi:MAG: GTPase HflX [Desulfobacterales bacterium]|jgi:GTP-binding protein HflX|nr:GTPase HflX [Desulfobacterales bacterium]